MIGLDSTFSILIDWLPERRLLDAAHIVSNKDERLGQPWLGVGSSTVRRVTDKNKVQK